MLEAAARWAVAQQGAPLPEEVLHHTKRAVVDWFAAVVPGGGMSPARILTAALVDDRTVGGSQLLPSGRTTSMRTAALVNGTAAHTAEVDDIFRDGVYHPGAPTIAAALAAAQDLGVDGDSFLRAVWVGFELSTRVAATIQPAHYRYWHTTGTVGTLGAAAAVATLLGCDEGRLAHAITTATTMAAGLQQAFRSDAMSKPLHAGHAAEAGTLAALAAHMGFTGAPDILEGAAGFGAAMSDDPDWSKVFDDLDEVRNITLMTFKNHACCGHTFAAIDGALQLRDEEAIAVEDVAAVEVETYATAIKVAGNPEPTTAFEAQFSIPYTVAAALRLGSVRLAAFEPEVLRDAGLRELVSRVSVAVDPELDAAFPGQRGARVRIHLHDGRTVERFRHTRKGDPDLPLTDEELTGKFRDLVEPVLGGAASDVLASRLWSLEDQSDLGDLTGPATTTADHR